MASYIPFKITIKSYIFPASYLTLILNKFAAVYVQVWPIDIDLKFMEPVGRELKTIGKVN